MLLVDLNKILFKVYNEREDYFSGIGILICDNVKDIPIHPIYNNEYTKDGANLSDQLKNISNLKNTHHDGFHVISTHLKLTHTAQYFYPKPYKEISLNSNKNYGARYFVAQIGSVIPEIIYSAVVGKNYGVCIFENGKKIEENII